MNKWTLHYFLVVLFLSLLCSCAIAQVVEGRADLSGHNFDNDGQYKLSGVWEFYWNQLLTPEDIKTGPDRKWMPVPGSWEQQLGFSARGFATYHVRLKLPAQQNNLSLFFPIINSSAKIWINGELAEETGRVSSDAAKYMPKLMSTVVSIPPDTIEVDLVIQVANYVYSHGGIATTPQIDKSSRIFARMSTANGIENFFAGSLIAMFIYQTILYFLYYRGKPHLWLALICFGVAVRSLIVHGGSFLLPNLFPAVEWEYWKKIEFGAVYAIGALFPLYVKDLFPDYAPRKPIIFFIAITLLLCIAVVVTPQYIYGNLLDVSHVTLILAFIYGVYSIGKAWRAGNKDARIILFGVFAAFPFILTEIVKNSHFSPVHIHFKYMVEIGVLIFLLFQVYLLAHHYAKSYKNLENMNRDLEKIIAERTGQLMTANEVKDRLLAVMSHDIKSPLNALRGILQVYKKGAIAKEEFGQYTRHIENDLCKTSILVENILYWTSSQLKGVQVRMEMFDLYALVEDNFVLFETIADDKKIVLNHNIPKPFPVRSDKNILNFVLRNLIANAIKFSFEEGTVNIFVTQTHGSLLIQVKDQGVGMDELTLQTLLTPELAVGVKGETGTGLGLVLCRDYLQHANGLLMVESTRKGKGSTFNILLASR